MQEKAIVTEIQVDKRFAWVHFQVKLPRDAKRMIGIETGMSMQENYGGGLAFPAFPERFTISRNLPVGELSLQGLMPANQLYKTDIQERDLSTGFGDFCLTEGFQSENWSQGTKREEENIEVEISNRTLIGQFRDMGTIPIPYTVKVVIWYKRREI